MSDETLNPSGLYKLLADALERMPCDEFTVYVHPSGMDFVPYKALAQRCLKRNPKTGNHCDGTLGHGYTHGVASTGETWHDWTYLKSLLDGAE